MQEPIAKARDVFEATPRAEINVLMEKGNFQDDNGYPFWVANTPIDSVTQLMRKKTAASSGNHDFQ
jgi:hypothetical protein